MFTTMLLFFSVTSADTPYSNEFERNLFQYELFRQFAPVHDGYRVREYLYYVKGTADTLHELGEICLDTDLDLEDLGDIVASYFRGRQSRLKREPAVRLVRESLTMTYVCEG